MPIAPAAASTAGHGQISPSTVTVNLVRRVGKPIAVAVTATAALTKRVGKTIAATATATVALTRQVGKVIAAAATHTVALERTTLKNHISLVGETADAVVTIIKDPRDQKDTIFLDYKDSGMFAVRGIKDFMRHVGALSRGNA